MLLRIKDGEWFQCEAIGVWTSRTTDGKDVVELRIRDEAGQHAASVALSVQEAAGLKESLDFILRPGVLGAGP